MLHALDGAEREPGSGIRDGCGEAVDTDLQSARLLMSGLLLDDAPAFLLHICNGLPLCRQADLSNHSRAGRI
jgi:hypothetical protein